jgi:hypothetical protein
MDRRSPAHRDPHPITQQAYEEAMLRLHGTRSLLDTVPLDRFVAVDESVGDPVDGMRVLAGAHPEQIVRELDHDTDPSENTDPSEDPAC